MKLFGKKHEPGISILDALNDPHLFRSFFSGKSWRPWIIALSALFGLAVPDRAGRELYTQCTKRERWPHKPAREGWFCVGRRGGKSRVAALVAVFLACFRDYAAILAPGEVATILVIASDRAQARVVFGYIRALLTAVPMLARMIVSEKAECIELSNRVRIEVATCSFRATRGYTIAVCVCDEIAYWRSEESSRPDVEVLNAIRPGMATIPGALLLCISSPYARRGALWQAHSKHFGKDSAVLVWQAPTRVMNATVAQDVIDDALAADSESARAEYLAEFRSDLETFVNADALRGCVAAGCFERAPVVGIRYFGFVDPSGGSSDSMTLGIAHLEGERALLDVIREEKAPFSPETVTAEFAGTLKSYRITTAYGDRYAAEWVREQFAKHGIDLRASEQNRSEIYLEVLPAINSRQIELLDHPRMLRQFETLERRTGRGTGKDSVDHPPGLHDDVANAGAGALCLALRELGGAHGWAVQGARAWHESGGQVRNLSGSAASAVLPHPADVAFSSAQKQSSGAKLFGEDRTGYTGQHPPFVPVKSASPCNCPDCGKPMQVLGETKRCNLCGYSDRQDSQVRVRTTFGWDGASH